ncbi:MAG: hypothetical protein ACI9VR_003640 [Cognaticolwellia sp.]|jgi:hypothetical protein
MKTESMNRALAATARIACLVALVGCRNSGESYTVDLDSGALDSGAPDSGPVDGASIDSGGCELDTGEEPECSLSWAVSNYSEDQDNSLIEPCCELLLDQVGYIGECCNVVGWDNPACMAWGPPRPPAVGRKIRAAQGAQRVALAARAGVAAALAA